MIFEEIPHYILRSLICRSMFLHRLCILHPYSHFPIIQRYQIPQYYYNCCLQLIANSFWPLILQSRHPCIKWTIYDVTCSVLIWGLSPDCCPPPLPSLFQCLKTLNCKIMVPLLSSDISPKSELLTCGMFTIISSKSELLTCSVNLWFYYHQLNVRTVNLCELYYYNF